jgi:hypothetical protein
MNNQQDDAQEQFHRAGIVASGTALDRLSA